MTDSRTLLDAAKIFSDRWIHLTTEVVRRAADHVLDEVGDPRCRHGRESRALRTAELPG